MGSVGFEPGSIVRVRSRQYLVEEVIPPPKPGEDPKAWQKSLMEPQAAK